MYYISILKYYCHHHHHHQSVLPKGRSFTVNAGAKVAVMFKSRSSTSNSGTKVAIFLGINRCGSFPVLYATTLSLASQQTLQDLKGPRGPNTEARRVDLFNWALRTSLKFTTGVKYQFHQGYWPDQRSENPNHPSNIIKIIIFRNISIIGCRYCKTIFIVSYWPIFPLFSTYTVRSD